MHASRKFNHLRRLDFSKTLGWYVKPWGWHFSLMLLLDVSLWKSNACYLKTKPLREIAYSFCSHIARIWGWNECENIAHSTFGDILLGWSELKKANECYILDYWMLWKNYCMLATNPPTSIDRMFAHFCYFLYTCSSNNSTPHEKKNPQSRRFLQFCSDDLLVNLSSAGVWNLVPNLGRGKLPKRPTVRPRENWPKKPKTRKVVGNPTIVQG